MRRGARPAAARRMTRATASASLRVRRCTDLLAEALHEDGTGAHQLVRRLTSDADVRAVGDRTVRRGIAEAVRHLELDLRIHGLDVLHQLLAVVADDPAEEDGLGT